MDKQLEEIKPKIMKLLKKNKVKKAGIFGSFARGEATKKSDLDLLVEMGKGQSLLDLIHLENELSKEIRKKVDLITYDSINYLLKERILREEIRLL